MFRVARAYMVKHMELPFFLPCRTVHILPIPFRENLMVQRPVPFA